MSYLVLARKWRPHDFNSMVGQEHVLRALMNALDQQRLHHAYLFTGTRGVGKTTVARIFAKCLNCEQGISSTPCNQCSSCQEIDAGHFVDLIEVDAASRTKVEDTRELLDNVQYAPSKGRFKVYLIDEVHMLSSYSFNALLKTLEEPPAHVKFLLATTDPQRLPITVLSRCLQFHMKNLTPELISEYLAEVAKKENMTVEDKSIQKIAHAANGSMRDALSLLDQAIAYGAGNVSYTDVCNMLGSIESTHLFELISALIQQDGNALLSTVQHLAEHAADFYTVLEELLSTLHQMAIAQALPDNPFYRGENSEQIKQLASQLTAEDIQLFYQIALTGRKDLPLAPSTKAGFEMVLLRMLAFSFDNIETQLIPNTQSRAASTSQRVQPPPTPAARKAQSASPSPAPRQSKTPRPNTASSDADLQKNWHQVVTQLAITGPTKMLAQHCVVSDYTGNLLTLLLEPKQAAFMNNKQQARLEQAINTFLQKSIKLQIKIEDPNQDTPAQIAQKNQQASLDNTQSALNQDPTVQALTETFGAKMMTDTLKPANSTE